MRPGRKDTNRIYLHENLPSAQNTEENETGNHREGGRLMDHNP